ncbi:arylsulfotransferase family protein [Dongia deserti]|uniref:arylsulfotransferase family protein n=1 Tax=Dongia deserti TaxID=2268030 RepID=UPI0013C411BD|nr:arylsulfotransferase family protein [Dongia deserti]
MFDKLGSVLFMAAVAFLAFVGGAMAVLGEAFPHRYLRDAYLAGEALIAQREETADPYVTDQWRKARNGEKGVTIHDPSRALEGYTLYTSAGEAAAHLIDMDGRVVHQWRRPYSEIWHQGSEIKKPQPDNLILMDKARLLPNGDLLAIYAAAGDTPWGYGMVKMDRDSNVIWSYLAHTHHDFDVAPDGRILVLTNAFSSDNPEGMGKLDQPYLEDFVVVLSPDGKELNKISLTRALAQSRYKLLHLAIPGYASGDPLHANSVQYITAEQAQNFPFAKEGDVLLSFRDMSAIAVVSLETGEMVWAMRGPWLWQHDASLLPNGHITLFDNLGGFRDANAARVLEVDPKTGAVLWSYQGDESHPFHSPLRSSVETLPNGNALITESDGGRIFEVTRQGEIVWNFVNPTRGGANGDMIAIATWGQRIDPGTLDPDVRTLFETRKEASK